MIKINIENIDYIKAQHRKYIEDNIAPKIDLYSIFNLSENKVADFIVNILGKDLHKITLEKWGFEYIKEIDQKYKNIKDKRIVDYINIEVIQSVLNKIEEYLNGLTRTDNKETRKERLKLMIEEIQKISLNKIDLSNFNIGDIDFKQKSEIENSIKPIVDFLKKTIKKKKKQDDYCTLKDIINKIFNYDSFSSDKDTSWSRHKLLYQMNIDSCPYCNMNYINNYTKDEKVKTTADLDHFLCKDKYPYLALSLYNFIPSCTICNSRLKIDDDFLDENKVHIFPNEEAFGRDAVFRTSLNENSDLDYFLGNSLNFDITIDITTQEDIKLKKIKNSIETFDLRERYSSQKEFVRDIIKKINVYNDDEIMQMLNISGLFDSEEELKNFIFGFDLNQNNLSKKPLSKLALDIFEEFSLFY